MNIIKTFEEFITEAVESSFKYLIGSFETKNDETLLSGSEFYDNSPMLQAYITKDNLEKIFKYGENNRNNREIKQRPEPLVANYGNKPKNFAFRRWVKDVISDPSNDIELKQIIPDSKFHNTNLKGNGYVLTAQDVEDVISIAYNNINGIEVLLKEAETKADIIMAYYLENKETYDAIASKITKGTSCIKKMPNKDSVSSIWLKLGEYAETGGKPNNTPKTDIISNDNKIRISIKKARGAQLMSGGYNETLATIKTAMLNCGYSQKQINEDPVIIALTSSSETWKSTKINSGIKYLKDTEESKLTPEELQLKQMIMSGSENNTLIKTLIEKLPPDVQKAIIREAITGENKFGEKSSSCATSVLVWDEKNPENSIFMDADDYVNHVISQGYEFILAYKSSSGKSWRSMRIIVGTASPDDSPSFSN